MSGVIEALEEIAKLIDECMEILELNEDNPRAPNEM